MATTYYNDIQKLYVAYFNRPADPAGLAFWEGAVEAAKGSTAAVSAAFAGSAEYKAAYANLTNAQIVDAVYQNLFGRPAEDAGKAYWANLLDKGTVTIDAVVTAVAAGAQGTDMTAYNNKVTAAAAFTAAVDTDAEKAGYSGADANKIAKTYLASVTDNASLAVATAPAALNTSVATTVAAGTPFTVAGALSTLNTANAAEASFLTGLKTDVAGVATAQTTAVAAVAGDLSDATAASLYASTTSQTVRDALVAAQQATNAATLTAAQKTLSDDNAAIAKVAGLTTALSTLTAANTALKSAQTAETAARADLVAKEAAFSVNNSGDAATSATVSDDGTKLQYTKAGAPVVLATIDANGKATIADGVDASKFTGLTDLITSFNTETTAVGSVAKAQTNVDNAHLSVNVLDVAADAVGTIDVGGTAYTETALIKAIADTINTTTPKTVAAGAAPTVAQIQTELAVLKAQADQTAYTNFKALVDAETASGDAFNTLITKQTTDTAAVKAAGDAITDLAKDIAAVQTAQANVNTLAGLQATADAAAKVLTDKGYAVVTLDADHAAPFATAASDVYVTAKHDATIGAFGLQGSDVLSVGKGYTLVQGAIGAKGVTANDAALEIFVSQSGGDAVLQFENHAYSSNVAGTAGEVFTITLTGVDASTLHLDSNGIITSGTTTA